PLDQGRGRVADGGRAGLRRQAQREVRPAAQGALGLAAAARGPGAGGAGRLLAARRQRPRPPRPAGGERAKAGPRPPAHPPGPTLIRRVPFDLSGLPPTPAEIDAFVQDRSPQALAKVVDRLLASPAFGERWGRHWLDVARYAESTGSARNVPYPHAWRYRDYVIDAFHHDKPYDQFLREQIAGDLLPFQSAEQRDRHSIAPGFLALGARS